MYAKVKRSLFIGVGIFLMLGIGVALAHSTSANKPNQEPKKVFVCKYVGTPHYNERLQTGNNPISVSVNAIQNNKWNGQVPGWFSDAHDRSYVLAYDTGQPKPSVSSCPAPAYPRDAKASVSVVPATCDAPAKLIYGNTTYAAYSGTANNSVGPRSYTVTATASSGHLFSTGAPTLTFDGYLAGKIAAQSSNPWAPCYTPPALSPIVTYGHWKDGEKDCTTKAVVQTRKKTVVPRTYVSHYGAWHIVYGTPVVTTETRTRDMNSYERARCEPTEEPVYDKATATVRIKNATCEVGQELEYVTENAYAAEGSTADGTFGAPTPYSVTFLAAEGARFAENADTTFTGTLAGPLTGEACVLGSGATADPTTPSTPAVPTATSAPAVLPTTTGEGAAAIILGGSLLAVILGFAGARRYLARSL